ncbi:MAG: IS200/IS605 family element transposase accessory protein TnpB [Acidobacteriia bacterium]|nr:IS200/IS605 family element transposase accessory protein TnpB [Terriglobia bacterium]MYG02434.1 IS200/IS605 family element transposase accessory protein TnpB [Terriglobia bacterium]MYK09658.1 IS200/IS605 family element transposase accessory protein TnpB [Terriglobia bacterium]
MTAPATYLIRLKSSPTGYALMESILGRLNWLYNQALERRKTAYQEREESLSLYDQYRWLTQLRAANEHGLGEIAVGASRGMLRRLDQAFQAFFRRVREGEAPGFPRFRSIRRCVTIDVAGPHNGMVRSQNGRYLIRVKGFPRLWAYSGRRLPLDAPLKALRLTKRGRQWEAALVYEVERAALPASVSAVGIDMGVRKRMTCSDGTRYARGRRNRRRQRKLQRALARCQQGSRNRGKRRAALARQARKEHVRERNACHRATTEIIRRHGLIAVEKLQIKNMTRSAKGTAAEPGSQVQAKAGLNREVLAQNWSLLFSQLRYKAGWAGRELVEVNPQYTSQQCSRCGSRNRPGKSETYRCRCCGLVADRDVNAALNILAAGVIAAGAQTWAVGPCVAPEPYAEAA